MLASMLQRRTIIVVLAATLAATVLSGCEVRVAGKRCTMGSPLAQDTTHVLECRGGRWTRVATKQEVAERLLAYLHATPTVIAASDGHACASMLDRTVRCWGRNTSGQLGNATTTSSSTPVDVVGLRIESSWSTGPGRSGVTGPGALALGDAYSCGISPGRAGTASTTTYWCWGAVHDPTDIVTKPELIGGGGTPGIASLVFGPTAHCESLELNYGYRCSIYQLILPSGTKLATAGRAHECLVASNDMLYCVGDNDRGQLGNGSTTAIPFVPYPSTLAATGLTDARIVDAGGDSTCAVVGASDVWCWGGNGRGQLGDGTTTDRTLPTRVAGLSDVVSLSVGTDHACAAGGSGVLRCWGANTSGQLGDSTTIDHPSPAVVSGLTNVTSVTAGAGSTCAIGDRGTAKQQVFCWGRNDWGQVGDGTTTERREPTLVRF